MEIYMLMLLSAMIGGMGSVTQKLWQKKTMQISHAGSVYLLVMSVAATGIFFVMSGCSAAVNRYTLSCSAFYAMISILSTILVIAAMSHMSLLLCSVFQRGSTLLVWLWGILMMRDSIRAVSVISAFLMLASILTPLCGGRKHAVDGRAVLLGIALMMCGAAAAVLQKYYTQSPQKMSNATLCFYTNLFILFYVLLRLACSKHKKEQLAAFRNTGKYQLLILLGTLGSNLTSVLSLYIMRYMPISRYSILSSAIGFVIVFFNSKVIFREACSKQELVSFLLSVSAVLITFIPI